MTFRQIKITDPTTMRRVQESDDDDIFMGVLHRAMRTRGPLLDPVSDIAGPLGRDIPASVRDWALTSESRRYAKRVRRLGFCRSCAGSAMPPSASDI